jgi:hypothetical protein
MHISIIIVVRGIGCDIGEESSKVAYCRDKGIIMRQLGHTPHSVLVNGLSQDEESFP